LAIEKVSERKREKGSNQRKVESREEEASRTLISPIPLSPSPTPLDDSTNSTATTPEFPFRSLSLQTAWPVEPCTQT